MNILIIGEFSGFAKHLKYGFEKLGHNVVIVLNGDGWKGFTPTGNDIFYKNKTWKLFGLAIRGTGKLDAFLENRRIHSELKRLFPTGIDVIFCVHYSFLSSHWWQCGVKQDFVSFYIKKGAKLIMSECGGTMAGRYNNPELYKSFGYDEMPVKEERYSFLLERSQLIIPTAYGYYVDLLAYAKYNPYDITKVAHAIPLPITVDEKYIYNPCVGKKIVIFHGIINPEKKGTKYIKAAMEKIQEEYPERVECICKGGMPYDEYIRLFDRIDILIDQCNIREGGWGINSTIGAMKAKCVLVSCGDKNQEHMGIPEIPFVPIKTDSNQIYEVLKDLVTHPGKIDDLKLAGRRFTEKYCETSIVAKKYLNLLGDKQ